MSSTPDTANRTPQGPFDPLLCPVCGLDLRPEGQSLHCAHQHTFDRARQGYVSLLTGDKRAPSADNAAMVQARATFLAGNHYAPLARSLARLVPAWCPADGMVLDAGVGTGYYLAAILESLPQAFGLGLDSSKFALRRAARAHPRMGAVAWDVWRPLPVRTGSVDVLVNVFAPRNGGEFHRVLRPGGALVVVTPTARHLIELRHAIDLLTVDEAKEHRLHLTLSGHFGTPELTRTCEYPLELSGDDLWNLVSMGPNAHRLSGDALRGRLATVSTPARVTASFRLSVYRPSRAENPMDSLAGEG